MVRTYLLVPACSILIVIASMSPGRAQACPVHLRSIIHAGRAASQSFDSYQVRITGSPGAFASIVFALKKAGGSDAGTTIWKGVSIAAPRDKGWGATGAAGTFDIRAADVMAAAVDRVTTIHGSKPIVCDRAWVAVGDPNDVSNVFVVVDDEMHAFEASVENRTEPTSSTESIVSSDIVSKVEPNYPAAAQDAGTQGDVTIRVTIGPDGKLLNAVVANSSNSKALDAAALYAARATTYKPPLVDGKPAQRDYTIVYAFRLDDDTGYGGPLCPLTIENAYVVNVGLPFNVDWLQIRVMATRSDIVSAVFALHTTSGTVIGDRWAPITLRFLDTTTKITHATAMLPWTGPEIDRAWIYSVTYADSSKSMCGIYYVPVEHASGVERLPLKIAAPTRLDGAYTEFNAPPESVAYPAYPTPELTKGTTGTAAIDVLVDPDGSVREAFLTNSSDNADLDDAALDAALKDRYPAAPSAKPDQIRVYTITYKFVVNPQ